MQPKVGYLLEDREGWDVDPTRIEFVKEGELNRWETRNKVRIVYWEIPEDD